MKPKAINENITEGKKGECGICAKAEYIKTSGTSSNSIELIEEIIKMSDEEFQVLCMAALREYGDPVMEKLWLIRHETKAL